MAGLINRLPRFVAWSLVNWHGPIIQGLPTGIPDRGSPTIGRGTEKIPFIFVGLSIWRVRWSIGPERPACSSRCAYIVDTLINMDSTSIWQTHEGYAVYGYRPDRIETAIRARQRLIQYARTVAAKTPEPLDELQFVTQAVPSLISRVFEFRDEAEVAAQSARNSGWKHVEVRSVRRWLKGFTDYGDNHD